MAKPSKSQSPDPQADAADSPGGYGKPPKKNQFKAGQSGNPRGSSRKVRARKAAEIGLPLDQIILKESERKVAINEDGVRSEITITEAAMRKLAVNAAKGERAAQKQYFAHLHSALERQHNEKTARFGLLVQHKNEQIALRASASILGAAPIWPHPDDVQLDYRDCTGHVVGPIDAQQTQPFIELVEDYRVWHARLAQVQTMASQAGGELRDLYEHALSVIPRLLHAIHHYLPPSFKVQLDWEASGIPAGALDVEGLDGEPVNLALLPPGGNGAAYGLYQLATGARSASGEVRDRARLNIAANTTSLINRLQVERQSRDAGMAPPPAAPEFDQFYDDFAAVGHGTADEGAP